MVTDNDTVAVRDDLFKVTVFIHLSSNSALTVYF